MKALEFWNLQALLFAELDWNIAASNVTFPTGLPIGWSNPRFSLHQIQSTFGPVRTGTPHKAYDKTRRAMQQQERRQQASELLALKW